jgi:hypothetical protein
MLTGNDDAALERLYGMLGMCLSALRRYKHKQPLAYRWIKLAYERIRHAITALHGGHMTVYKLMVHDACKYIHWANAELRCSSAEVFA